MISRALSEYAFICVFRSLKDCFAFVNTFAPEHLEMLIEDVETYLKEVNNVGLITLGEYAFTSLSDYCLGTNHVLPTCGYAETHSGLSVRNFVKVIQVATAEKKTLKKCHSLMRVLTDGEGLPNHLTSLEARLRG
ncbi:MAG: hypothetical protein GTN80_11225 [Nitrososphaeria archaeon]|nr:hypothetical protein [Nitrososphaeria archaeon]NIN53656.1 hypothetical protein [Nitrososphaeria archaeon]NIQ34189.1 hypothetical protein [Nitrososphaeria archaeon]